MTASTLSDEATVTDLFCGAGGSSIGAEAAGARIVMAANHWTVAIKVHQGWFPNARHDCADISQADPRRYIRTRILIASPECTNHSQARGVSRKRQDPNLFDAPDPSAERSRATMWDVIRFTEQMRYDAVVVENVVEATKWVLWSTWRKGVEDLGYVMTLLSHNSMDHAVPQSRDRIYAVWLPKGLKADLEMERDAWCSRCSDARVVRQAWKNGRTVGRYGSQWIWTCTTCGTQCKPTTEPAASIIDFGLPCPPLGSKRRAPKTRERIWAGMVRHGWVPILTSGAGNVHERTPGNRARTLDDVLPTQQTSLTSALATPPPFMMATHHQGRTAPIDEPHPTVTASNDRLSLVVHMRGTSDSSIGSSTRSTQEPIGTVSASGGHHALVMSYNGNGQTHEAEQPLTSVVGSARHGLLVSPFGTGDGAGRVRPTNEPMRTQGTTNRPALLMRNNTDSGRGEMTTSVNEPARTFVSKPNQALLTWPLSPEHEGVLDQVGFRMLEPFEVAAAMAFPVDYIPRDLAKDVQVKLAGNAVTPPVMAWIIGRVIRALEAAA